MLEAVPPEPLCLTGLRTVYRNKPTQRKSERRFFLKFVDNLGEVCYYAFRDTSSVVWKGCYMVQGSLPTRLRVLRAERGLTLREAAAMTDVRPGTLSELERGVRHPHDVTLSRIAKGYGVPVEELLEEPVPLAEAPTETGRGPAFYDQGERLLRYLRLLQLFATDMHETWAAKVERDEFGAVEFEHAAATLLALDAAYAHGVGTDLLAALLNRELVLPEAEREAFNSAKASIDAWHHTMWRAYDTLRERGAENVVRLDRFREAFEAWDRGDRVDRAAGE